MGVFRLLTNFYENTGRLHLLFSKSFLTFVVAMKKYVKYLGLPLVYAGVLLLAISYVVRTTSNLLLFAGLGCIVAGIIGYVYAVRHTSKY